MPVAATQVQELLAGARVAGPQCFYGIENIAIRHWLVNFPHPLRAFQSFQKFQSFKPFTGLFDGLNDLNGLNPTQSVCLCPLC